MSTNKANLAFKMTFLVAMVTGMVAMETEDLRSFLNLSPNLFQVYFGVDLAIKITLSWLSWQQIGYYGNQCPSGNSAPITNVPAKFGAHWPINCGGDVEQTNPKHFQIIVY